MRKINDFPVIPGVDPETQAALHLIAVETFRRLEERARIEDGKERTILDVLYDVSLRLTGYDPRLPEYVNGRDVDVLLWEEWFDEPYDDGVPADIIVHWMKDAGGALMDAHNYFKFLVKIQDPPFANVRRVAQYFLAEIDRPKWKPTLEQELQKFLDQSLFRRVLKEAVDMEESEHWKLNVFEIGNEKFSSLVRLFLKEYGREEVERLTDKRWRPRL